MKSKLFILCLILVSSITLKAQNPQIIDENSNKWEFLETVQGTIWDEIMFQNTGNPWAPYTSTSGLYLLWGKMYIYYRQIGNKMLLRMIPRHKNELYNVQPNPYFGKEDRYGRGQYEYRVQVSRANIVYFNL